jgi:hypothetical protein
MKKTDLRSRMTANAKSYNKYLTDVYLEKLPLRDLLGFTGVMERTDFASEIVKLTTEADEEN